MFSPVTGSNWFERNTQKQIAKKKKKNPQRPCLIASKESWSLPLNYSHSITTFRAFQKLFHTRVGNSKENCHSREGASGLRSRKK